MAASNKSHEMFCEVKFALSMIPPQPRIFTFLPSLTKASLLKALKESHRMSPTLRKDKEKDKDKDGDGDEALRYTSWQLLKRQHLLGVKPTWEASRLAGLFRAGNQGPWQAENLFSWEKVRTTKTQLFNCYFNITRPYTNLDQWSSLEFQMQNLDQISALKFLFSETYWEKK